MTTVTITEEIVARIRSGKGRVMTERERRMTPGELAVHRASRRLTAAEVELNRARATHVWTLGMTEESAVAEVAEARAALRAAWAVEE